VLLLDTHAWVWVVEGHARRVGRRARQLLGRAEARDDIRVSPASIFEATTLYTSGRLHLARPVEQWMRDALSAPGVRVAELTPTIAIDAGAIPRTTLPDPLDRILVATARQLGAALVTGDRPILDYAMRTGAVRVHDVRT
jgi:PIN domain nuclease of toxin-antitoxin system